MPLSNDCRIASTIWINAVLCVPDWVFFFCFAHSSWMNQIFTSFTIEFSDKYHNLSVNAFYSPMHYSKWSNHILHCCLLQSASPEAPWSRWRTYNIIINLKFSPCFSYFSQNLYFVVAEMTFSVCLLINPNTQEIMSSYLSTMESKSSYISFSNLIASVQWCFIFFFRVKHIDFIFLIKIICKFSSNCFPFVQHE